MELKISNFQIVELDWPTIPANLTSNSVIVTTSPSYFDAESVALFMSNLSSEEPAILERSPSFYFNLINRNLAVFAIHDSKVVGSLCLLPLSENFAEMSTGWIAKGYRGRGLYSAIKNKIQKLAQLYGYRLIGTTQPQSGDDSQAIISSAKKGIFPVSFNFLKNRDLKAYQSTCCCSENRNYKSCELRDNQCILSVDVKDDERNQEAAISFMKSNNWKKTKVPESTRHSIEVLAQFESLELETR